MSIQWYPGHMHKASKQIKELLPEVDLIIEVLDARIPFSSDNPMIASLRGDKPCIKVLSKSDLADPDITRLWQEYLEREKGVKTITLSTEQPEKIRQLNDLCRKMVPKKDDGVGSINTMIMGIPNVGKSTLINTMAGRTIAKTGNEPAVTKGQQRINLRNGIILFDTPGMLWPKVENDNSGYRLATTGAIKDTAIEHEDVAYFAAGFLLSNYPDRLLQRYELDNLPASEIELLEILGKKRGCLRGGGHVDFEKISQILLHELRAGLLGPLSFETPSVIEKELAELAIILAEKEAKKTARKEKFKSKRKK